MRACAGVTTHCWGSQLHGGWDPPSLCFMELDEGCLWARVVFTHLLCPVPAPQASGHPD